MDPAPSLPNAATSRAIASSADKRSLFYDLIAFFLEAGIRIWARITGKRISEVDTPWLRCPLGERGRIWLIVEFISRRMEQLNFPISSLEVAKGMSSEVVQLLEPGSDRLAYTGWLRRLSPPATSFTTGSIPSCQSRVRRFRA
jgi:hypothetical protein